MSDATPQPITFADFKLNKQLLTAVAEAGFTEPTPVQQQTIPLLLAGHDVLGIAQTGTGKTLAFGLPMIQRLAQVKGRGLVILPTRELALQVDESLMRIGKTIGLRTAVLIGGMDMKRQIQPYNDPNQRLSSELGDAIVRFITKVSTR